MSTPPESVIGYYRFTDIKFDWAQSKSISEEDSEALRRILGPFSLVHPEHPLHIEGIEGIRLYHGTFQTGEVRLLFSSAQVEFIRHWLHATGSTKELLPLPYSDCLLTMESDLQSEPKPVNYPTEKDVKTALKMVDKNNKKLKNVDSDLRVRRFTFELAQAHWATHRGVWCAIDFEGWEMQHDAITEIGYSTIYWDPQGNEIRENKHLIVKEHRSLRNGKYVADNRYNYNFGTSEEIANKAFVEHVHKLILEVLPKHGPVFLVFHDYGQDKKFLKDSIKLPVEETLKLTLPLVSQDAPSRGHFVVDTTELFGALEGISHTRRSLLQVCRHLKIQTLHLHNAGNDAWYTLEAMKTMITGPPLDTQREQRWPSHTAPNSATVKFTPTEEDSDYESPLEDMDMDMDM